VCLAGWLGILVRKGALIAAGAFGAVGVVVGSLPGIVQHGVGGDDVA